MKINMTCLSVAVAASLITCSGFAQETPRSMQANPEGLAKALQSMSDLQINAAVTSAKPVANAMIDAQTEAGARPEVADRIAAFKRNLYNALRTKGFTADEALQIVIATQPPLPINAR